MCLINSKLELIKLSGVILINSIIGSDWRLHEKRVGGKELGVRAKEFLKKIKNSTRRKLGGHIKFFIEVKS